MRKAKFWLRFHKIGKFVDYAMLVVTGICFLLGIGNRVVMATAFLVILFFDLPATRRRIENAEYALDEARLEKERELRRTDSTARHLNNDFTTPLSVLAHPCDCVGAVGENASFTVIVEEDPVYYQWQVSHDGGKSWWDIPISQGGRSSALCIAINDGYDGYLYHCVVWNDDGKRGVSNAARLILG